MQMAGDIATCMFYTGVDPFTKQQVYVAQHLRDRKLQRALSSFSSRWVGIGTEGHFSEVKIRNE